MAYYQRNLPSISDSGANIVSELEDLNVTGDGSVTSDGDGTATLDITGGTGSGIFSGGDIHVVGSGDLIQDAVDAAVDGDMVWVTRQYDQDALGADNEIFPINVTDKITMIGSGKDHTNTDYFYDVHGGYMNSDTSKGMFHVETGGNAPPGFATINFNIAGAGVHGYVLDCRHTVHVNSGVYDTNNGGDGYHVGDLDSTNNATNSHVWFGCVVQNASGNGWYFGDNNLRPPNFSGLHHCSALNSGEHGVRMEETATNMTIFDCNLEGSGRAGFRADSVTSTWLVGNYFETNSDKDGGASIRITDCRGMLIENNYINDISDHMKYGIRMWNQVHENADITIRNNTFNNFDSAMIKVEGGRHINITTDNQDLRSVEGPGDGTQIPLLVEDTTATDSTNADDYILIDGVVGSHKGGVNLGNFTPDGQRRIGLKALSNGTNTAGEGVIGTWDGSRWRCTDGTTVYP